ncbi:MAG: ABC transporter substrate-binding protein [Thermodesulfovibrionales bacterium]
MNGCAIAGEAGMSARGAKSRGKGSFLSNFREFRYTCLTIVMNSYPIAGAAVRSARITLVILLGIAIIGGAAFLSLPVHAADKTVGVIIPGDSPYYQEVHAAFQERLQKNRHADIIVQRPFPDPISLSNAARKLIATDVGVIVAYGTAAAKAAIQEKPSIPIVYVGVYAPLEQTLKFRNTTGVSANVPVTSLLRYLRGMATVKTLGVLYNPNEPDSRHQFQEVSRLGAQYGYTVEPMNLSVARNAATHFSNKKIDAVFVTGSALAGSVQASLSSYARERHVPVAALFGVKSGGAVVALSASPREQGALAAEKTVKILDGAPPEKLHSEASNDMELIFSMKEAAAIGCRIPMELVTEATTLIK